MTTNTDLMAAIERVRKAPVYNKVLDADPGDVLNICNALSARLGEPAPVTPDHLVEVVEQEVSRLAEEFTEWACRPMHSTPSGMPIEPPETALTVQRILAALNAAGALAGPGQVVVAVEVIACINTAARCENDNEARGWVDAACAALAAAPGEEQADER